MCNIICVVRKCDSDLTHSLMDNLCIFLILSIDYAYALLYLTLMSIDADGIDLILYFISRSRLEIGGCVLCLFFDSSLLLLLLICLCVYDHKLK